VDDQFIDVVIENAYPGYYSTVFYTLACPEFQQGWVRQIILEPVVDDDSEPDPLSYITVTTSLLEENQPIPSGEEVMGGLHVLVHQEAAQKVTYKFRLTIHTECGVLTCGTAYAYGGDDATCFLDPEYDEYDLGNKWGWTNGPLEEGYHTFDLYEGAGNCDLSKGTVIGTVTVDYDGGTATVTYTITDPDYTLDEIHLYVGSEPFPRNNQGNYTVSPGQYPYSGEETFTVHGLSGEIYVIAHAVPCWFE
jgi:hypothetical protein